MNDKWIKIKGIIPQILAVAFILLVIFYPNKQSQNLNPEDGSSVNLSASINHLVGVGDKVVYYGELKRFSTSGTLSFYFYDIEKSQLEQPDNPRHWFWAKPNDPKDTKEIDRILKIVSDNEGAIFKITGVRNKDDVDYYEDGTPIQDITIENIEVYSK